MKSTKEKNHDLLEKVFEKNHDAVNGFEKAAKNAKSEKRKADFVRKAKKRNSFNQELHIEINKIFTDFDNPDSFKGNIYKAWMDIKVLFTSDNDAAILDKAIRGDKAAVAEYKKNDVTDSLQTVLQHQINKIQTDIKRE